MAAYFIKYTYCSARAKDIRYSADWCNKTHFDYRGLIPMGLALEAPEGMYKT